MINATGVNSYNSNAFREFKTGGRENFFLNPQQQNEISEKTSHKGRNLVFIIGSSALLVGLGVLTLMIGLPKNTGKYLERIQNFLQKKIETSSLEGSDRLKEFYVYSLRKVDSFYEKTQSINNFASLKDVLFKNLMDRNKTTAKIHKKISNFFEKISRRTVISSYKSTGKKFNDMYKAFDRLDEMLLKSNPDEIIMYNGKEITKRELIKIAKTYRESVKVSVNEFISQNKLTERYKDIKSTTSSLYNQFWDESFKDFWSKNNKFRRKEMWQIFIPDVKIAQGKQTLADKVATVRNTITYTDADKINIINKHIKTLENLVAPSDKEGLAIIKKLKWFLSNPEGLNANSGTFLKELEKIQERPLQEGLSEAVKVSQQNLKQTYIKAINDLLNSKKSGELQEMLSIYEHIAPYETAMVKSKVTKAVKSFDKSLNLETIEFFDKVRDLELGSAPTDVLSIIASAGAIAYGLEQAKDSDERWSVTLKAGIPIIGTVATSLFCTAKLISGSKSLAFGLISGWILNKIGSVTDNMRKKYSQNPSNSQVA